MKEYTVKEKLNINWNRMAELTQKANLTEEEKDEKSYRIAIQNKFPGGGSIPDNFVFPAKVK